MQNISEIVKRLRQSPDYRKNLAAVPMAHPFHKRYNAKPEIYGVIEGDFHLNRFVLGKRDIESLELSENGLPLALIVIVPGKSWNFKTALEAECFIADYLGT